jgi:glycosyltransferase involved in cell wall biosynthesis
MQVARRISLELPDVVFLVAGQERSIYGHERHHIGEQTFKQYVLTRGSYDLDKFHFLGLIPTGELATLYNISDLHIYLTVPYVLSWSLIQAMASGCTILGSATAPVEEIIDHGVYGLLAGFYDVDALTQQALAVLRAPERFESLGAAARTRVLERYELEHCIGQLTGFFEQVAGANPAS